MFSGCTVLSDRKKTKLGSSDQEASPSESKYTGGSFSAMLADGSASLQLFLVVWIFLSSLGIIYYLGTWDLCLMNSEPTVLFLTYLN